MRKAGSGVEVLDGKVVARRVVDDGFPHFLDFALKLLDGIFKLAAAGDLVLHCGLEILNFFSNGIDAAGMLGTCGL